MKYCASHKVKLSVPPTPAGASLAKQTSRTEGVLIVPQGTLRSKKATFVSQTNVAFFVEQGTGVEPAFTAWEAVVLPIYEPCIVRVGIIALENGKFKYFLSWGCFYSPTTGRKINSCISSVCSRGTRQPQPGPGIHFPTGNTRCRPASRSWA